MTTAGGESLRRLCVYNGGFLYQPHLRALLRHAGYRVALGVPRAGDAVGVWGQSPTAHRGEAVAARYGAPLIRIEDAFLRSLFPGRRGEPPLGIMIDTTGVHFDASKPSDLEILLKTHPLDDAALLARARGTMARMQAGHLSKYSATRLDLTAPLPGYVLVVDQTAGDAAVRASRGDRARFLEMLFVAREENPGARILIKTHPETQAGLRAGHFRDADATGPVEIHDTPLSPWTLLEGATRVYTLSSQMGFEAILAGHRPRVFGGPFYAGWGLSDDEDVFPRRGRHLTRAQLFAGAMVLFPHWRSPYAEGPANIEAVIGALEAQSRAWREDRAGWVASGMRLWKRRPLQRFFGQHQPMRFEEDPAKAEQLAQDTQAQRMVWAGKAGQQKVVRLEDGFLRSRGLGAELVPPLSLALDDIGIYYDPRSPSRLETLIQRSATGLREDQTDRATRLIERLIANGLSKYNLAGEHPPLPGAVGQPRILVPGQVEDDASILTGSPDITSNAELLKRVRAANPDAMIVYKPHPDVLAGLRKGHVANPETWADLSLEGADISRLLETVDAVWTLTSLTGFEALLRGCHVTTLGAPFYAGWGLTQDLGRIPARRRHGPRPSLVQLVHAVLIAYPRYFDPKTGLACPIETTLTRLEQDDIPGPGPANRLLSKLQGLLSGHAHLWRR